MPEKTGLIVQAFEKFGLSSFADLGGVWGVEGGFTFFTLEKFDIKKAFLVDTDISEIVQRRQRSFPQLTLVRENFGSDKVVSKIGTVDTIFLFDTLLHQVSPDWDDILRMYSESTDHFLIFGRQYTGARTVRLFDLGEDGYFKNVPHKRNEEPYRTVFDKMYDNNPQHGRINRDIHNVWQWGIVNDDLVRVMKEVGFEKIYHENHGIWPGLEKIENHAFIFKKRRR